MKHAKKAFLASLLSVVLCVTMLVGTTYAWFTDSVTSAGNKIIAGTLDIDLYQWTNETAGTEITTSSAPIFGSGETANAVNASTLWEPGKTQIAYLSIRNNGNLWLKYTVKLVVKNVAKDLYKVMQYEIVPNAQYGALDNDSWATLDGLGKLSLASTEIALGASTTFGTSSTDVPMAPETEHFFALAIHMNEEAGNEYQAGEVDFDIQVLATQYTKEEDSFDDQYDFNATYPITSNAAATMSAAVEEDLIITKSGEIKSATVPAEAANALFAAATASAPEGSDNELTMNLNVEKVSETTTSTGQVVALEIDMSAVLKTTTGGTTSTSSAPVESLADYVTIEYELGAGLSNVVATHDGHAMGALASAAAPTENPYGGYYYDAESGVLTIKTKSFSPYTVTFDTLAENETTGEAFGALALAIAKASAGDRIALKQDLASASIAKTIVLNLNGHDVTALTAETDMSLTGDGSVAITAAEGATVTVIGGQHESISFAGNGSAVVAGGSYRTADVAATTEKITASGAYLIGPDTDNWYNYTLASGDFLVLNANGTTKGLYNTLTEACENGVENGTVRFIGSDMTVLFETGYQKQAEIYHTMTIDLNGHTIKTSGNVSYPIFGVTLHKNPKIMNGTIDTDAYILNNQRAYEAENLLIANPSACDPVYDSFHNYALKLPATVVVNGDGSYLINPTTEPTTFKAKLVRHYAVQVTTGLGSGFYDIEGDVTYIFTGEDGVSKALRMATDGASIEVHETYTDVISTSLPLNATLTISRPNGTVEFPVFTSSNGDIQDEVLDENTVRYTVIIAPLCHIGSTNYFSLRDAFNALGNNQTIVLDKDVILDRRIYIPAKSNTAGDNTLSGNRNYSLDFNGHIITHTSDYSDSYLICFQNGNTSYYNGGFTFKDTTQDKRGGMVVTKSGVDCIKYDAQYFGIIIQSGIYSSPDSIINCNKSSGYGGYGKLTISGGQFIQSTANNGGITLPTASGQIKAEKVVITGGTFAQSFFTRYNVEDKKGTEVVIGETTYYAYVP